MSDQARSLRFGYFLVPNADAPLVATAQHLERLGLDYIGIQDHPYQRRFVDTWTLLGVIAGATSKIRLLPDVANLPLRPPALLAKAAATLDVLSGGRVELGLGTGAFWDAIEAYGGPRRTPGESLEALAEAIEVIRKVWSGERNLRFAGRHYRLSGSNSGPTPAHPIGIWVGADGPRALRLVGRLADGWITSFRGSLSDYAEKAARLDDAAAEAGRDPASLRRILNVGGEITDGESRGPFQGPADQWVEQLTSLALDRRVDTFVLWAEGDGQIERFVEMVLPAVRSNVAAH